MSVEEAKVMDKGEMRKIEDSLQNLVANLGTNLDKRTQSTFRMRKFLSRDGNQQELDSIYREDWLAGKIVDIIPDDMVREWRAFTGDVSPAIVKQLVNEEARLNLQQSFNQAHKWARLYGTAFIVIAINDGLDPTEPLDLNRVKPGGLLHIQAIDRHRVNNAEQIPIADPMSPYFGMPQYYRFNETTQKIHCSRVLRFDGVKLPFDEFRRNNYYSDSVLSRLYDALTNFNVAADSSASLIYEAKIDVVKIKGLMNMLQSPEGEMRIKKRIRLSNLMKSINNTMILDAEEEWDTRSASFSGVSVLLNQFALFLSASSDIPATRLLGSSASGLNATGEGDLKNYYDTVRSAQKMIYKPLLDFFDPIMSRSLGLPDTADLSYEFNALFQMSPSDEASRHSALAQRDSVYLDQNVVTPAIVAEALNKEGVYAIPKEHIRELEAEEKEEDDDGDDNDDEKKGKDDGDSGTDTDKESKEK